MVTVENVGPAVGEQAGKENTHMSAEENKVLARRFFEEVAAQRNLDLAKELCSTPTTSTMIAGFLRRCRRAATPTSGTYLSTMMPFPTSS
jgi:hypothetical protein